MGDVLPFLLIVTNEAFGALLERHRLGGIKLVLGASAAALFDRVDPLEAQLAARESLVARFR